MGDRAFDAQPPSRSTRSLSVERIFMGHYPSDKNLSPGTPIRRSSHSVPLCWCRHHSLANCSRVERKMHPVRYTPRDSWRIAAGVGMKLIRLLVFAVAVVFAPSMSTASLRAQQAASASSPSPSVDSGATLSYIHAAWDSLTRSVTDCNSLADTKVDNAAAARPVLLPSG